MMRTLGTKRESVALVVVLCAMLPAATGAQQTAAELFERARLLEENARNLNRAVELYEQVVALAEADRTLAASAQLRIGLVRERQGKPEAREMFARVVREYTTEPAADVARARLASARTERRQELTPRRVLDGHWALMFDISSDGRFTVGPERRGYSSRDLVIRNVTTGQSTTLVPGSDGASGSQPRISNDGRRVAYSWNRSGGDELRVIETSPGASPSTFAAPAKTRITPVDWAPDGASLLIVLRRYSDSEYAQEQLRELAWFSLDTHAIRTIKTVEPWQSDFLMSRVSPDGHSVAFTLRPRRDSSDVYLYVVDAAGQSETAVVTSAGGRDYPVWTADGTHLLYTANAGGRSALWAIAMQNGRPSGEPAVIQSDFTGIPLGVTSSGAFYYRRSDPNVNYEYIVNRRPGTGDMVTRFPGMHVSWHRSNLIAFRGQGGDLIVRNLETGQERSYKQPGLRLTCGETCPTYWLPDASGVIVAAEQESEMVAGFGFYAPGRVTFYVVNLADGSFRRLFDRDTQEHVRTNVGAVSPDGKTMYLGVRDAATTQVRAIVAVDFATGEERTVVTFNAGTGRSPDVGIALSADGRTLAISAWKKANEEARMFTVDITGANYREIVSSFATGWLADKTRWTPDGRGLVFVAFDGERDWRVMRVPTEGGQPEFDGLDHRAMAALIPDLRMAQGNFNNIELSPDGARIAASTWTLGKHELWTLDGLLSVLNSR